MTPLATLEALVADAEANGYSRTEYPLVAEGVEAIAKLKEFMDSMEEMHALNQGASVHLSIWGDGHPPVYVGADGVP